MNFFLEFKLDLDIFGLLKMQAVKPSCHISFALKYLFQFFLKFILVWKCLTDKTS